MYLERGVHGGMPFILNESIYYISFKFLSIAYIFLLSIPCDYSFGFKLNMKHPRIYTVTYICVVLQIDEKHKADTIPMEGADF